MSILQLIVQRFVFSRKALPLILALFICFASQARADFSGPYSVPASFINLDGQYSSTTTVGAWTLVNTTPASFGVMTYFAGSSNQIDFETGLSLEHNAGNSHDVQLTDTIAASGMLSFDYSLKLETTDPAVIAYANYGGYFLNGILTKLALGTGSVSIPVAAGDLFSFDAYAGPNCVLCNPAFIGEANLSVTNFNAPVPEPSALFLVLGALSFLLWKTERFRRNRHARR